MKCASVYHDRQCVVTVGPDGKHTGLHESQYGARQWANEDDPRCMKYRQTGRASVALCGREIKAEGLCGPHLAAKRRSEAKAAERGAEEARRRARRDEITGLAAALSEHLGVRVGTYFDFGGASHVTLSADAVRAILAGQEATP